LDLIGSATFYSYLDGLAAGASLTGFFSFTGESLAGGASSTFSGLAFLPLLDLSTFSTGFYSFFGLFTTGFLTSGLASATYFLPLVVFFGTSTSSF
jgi:hypothetical protein